MNRYLSTALAVCLGLLSILPFFHQSYALDTYRTVTKYHLDMGVIHIWSNDNGTTWQNNLEYGKAPSAPFTASLTFPNKIQKVVKAYVLDEDDFKWNDTTGVYTFNEVKNYLTSSESYERNYKRYMSNSISSIKPAQTGDYTVDLSYKAKLEGLTFDYNLADMLNRGQFDDIIALLGGEGSVKPDLYKKLEAGKNGVGEGVLGYMFFIPIVIEYQVIEKVTLDIGEFEAGLEAPETALVGETFNVTDQSVFGDEAKFAETQLRYCVDGGSTKTATGWKGNALGETIVQSFDEACSVEYTITTWNEYGDYDTASKTVRVLSEDVHDKALTDVSQLSPWTPTSGVTVANATITEPEKDDEYIKIYKKGEKVLYNIFYDDYEEDPSKTQYWQYSHINWPPDTVHPDAGKVLTAPIDRFYLSGKYTVTHWQQDNTQRAGAVGDATPYNKDSNKVSLTFYIDGEGKAPWITYIKTEPAAVKENNSYGIKVGIDDSEKNTLTLETEVYLNGKIIKTDVKTGITANSAGVYPEQTISGLPKAVVGVYQVICTVSDYSGTGIKTYKFTVISEGKITGSVNHTDQWDTNRKKYNLKRFQDEINRLITMGEYLSKAIPRPRGVNVFWSGEQFLLLAETEGTPSSATVKIMEPGSGGTLQDTVYGGELRDTGRKNPSGAGLWEGSLWNQTMINRWGRKNPEELTFIFTAHYSEGITKTHTVTIIVDTERDYWQLHRLW